MVYNLFRIKKKRDVFEARLIKGGGKKPFVGFTGRYRDGKDFIAYMVLGINFIPRRLGYFLELSYIAENVFP
jgi:hypothetical protein